MKAGHPHFSLPARFFHWLMAPLVVAMLFIGVGMVATVSRLHLTLIALHRPLGIAILVLVVLRLIVRICCCSPCR
jgi:cytochrome b561